MRKVERECEYIKRFVMMKAKAVIMIMRNAIILS